MSKVQAQTKSVQQLLSGVTYDIDYYQRGYHWRRHNLEELLTDLEARFSARYSEEHEDWQVLDYPHYFLGTIITTSQRGSKYLVDGQQRLTTLTLLLIYFHHLKAEHPSLPSVEPLLYSEIILPKSLVIAVEEREDCMRALIADNHYDVSDHPNLSVRNIVERYEDIDDILPGFLTDKKLRFFLIWIIKCVNFVEIETQASDDAFTIFETMNDRGMRLSQADMLKGYLLANIKGGKPTAVAKHRANANEKWKDIIIKLVDLEKDNDYDVDNFFKIWLRAKHANAMRESKKDSKNQDFENIDKFHRWVRDNSERLGLKRTEDYYRFMSEDMRRFADHYITLRKAAKTLTCGLEAVSYNAYNNFTLQYMLALAPIRLDDSDKTAKEKMRLVATFADIYLVRRWVNRKNTGQSTLRYYIFSVTREIRDKSLGELREILARRLNELWETWSGLDYFALHGRNKRHVRYMLARMTAWVEQQTGSNVNYRQFLWDAKGKPFDIEHIWANNYEMNGDEFSSEEEFQRYRNYFGGLLLLPRPVNRSLNDKCYEYKLEKYREQNLLAASLNAQKYINEPNLIQFRDGASLPFKPYNQFKRADLMQRQELYRQICEQIWCPDRLNEI